jgi:uncharacterized protein (TIGR02246 family)
MRVRHAAGLMGVVLSLGGCAATSLTVTEDIKALEQQQVQAAVSGNRAALERIFAPDFRLINPSGAVASREELLAMLAGGPAPYRSASYVTESVLRYADVVVTTGTETVVPAQVAANGQSQRRRITHVWERQGDGWRLRLRHATLVAPPP